MTLVDPYGNSFDGCHCQSCGIALRSLSTTAEFLISLGVLSLQFQNPGAATGRVSVVGIVSVVDTGGRAMTGARAPAARHPHKTLRNWKQVVMGKTVQLQRAPPL